MLRRFDTATLRRAVRTPEGFIKDTPVVSRVGIFEYADPSYPTGIRREFRPPEEVFSAAHLQSLNEKPITFGHVQGIAQGRTDDTVIGYDGLPWKVIGTSTSAGFKDPNDPNNLLTNTLIYNTDALDNKGLREISLGYTLDLDETPGVWEGQPYDAVQRNLRVDHIAVVVSGRAGNARFNLDAKDLNFAQEQQKPMPQVRLDNGISYDAPPEVIAEIEALRTARTDAANTLARTEAERDTAKAALVTAQAEAASRADSIRQELRQRLELERTAQEHKVAVRADATDRSLREDIIRAVRKDSALSFDGKIDAYVEAVYDMTLQEAKPAERKDSAAAQLAAAFGTQPAAPSAEARADTADSAHKAMVEDFQNAWRGKE